MAGLESVLKVISAHRGVVPESQWLVEKGITDDKYAPYNFELVKDWYRGGSESYILDFKVNSGIDTKHLLVKACIKMCAVEVVSEWHDRRSRIRRAGIEVPKLYSTNRADYIEEFIDLDLRTAHIVAGTETRRKLEDRFINTYKKLNAIGFSIVSLHDVRSRGDDVVLVDFGSDLGGFTESQRSNESVEMKAEDDLRRILGN
jgi:hypothetical protein